jgi:hypothetical protein
MQATLSQGPSERSATRFYRWPTEHKWSFRFGTPELYCQYVYFQGKNQQKVSSSTSNPKTGKARKSAKAPVAMRRFREHNVPELGIRPSFSKTEQNAVQRSWNLVLYFVRF